MGKKRKRILPHVLVFYARTSRKKASSHVAADYLAPPGMAAGLYLTTKTGETIKPDSSFWITLACCYGIGVGCLIYLWRKAIKNPKGFRLPPCCPEGALGVWYPYYPDAGSQAGYVKH